MCPNESRPVLQPAVAVVSVPAGLLVSTDQLLIPRSPRHESLHRRLRRHRRRRRCASCVVSCCCRCGCRATCAWRRSLPRAESPRRHRLSGQQPDTGRQRISHSTQNRPGRGSGDIPQYRPGTLKTGGGGGLDRTRVTGTTRDRRHSGHYQHNVHTQRHW